ncbi:hypothetical protein SAY86_000151 [Trapa natans]|uniref:Uncharacterized protein n=1 Tax=Trapa natans TaxID=22666 RepID=A0AAN7RML8_TRANT|nr:hypothetical protein SAY86_000151 [Trapa natans]
MYVQRKENIQAIRLDEDYDTMRLSWDFCYDEEIDVNISLSNLETLGMDLPESWITEVILDKWALNYIYEEEEEIS